MILWIQEILTRFADFTALAGRIPLEILADTRLYLVLGALLLGLGIHCYRWLAGGAAFLAVAAGLTAWMQGRAAWSQTVTAFVLIGMLVAAMVFNWKKVDAVLLCAFVAALPLHLLGQAWWLAALVGLLAGAVAYFFPLAGVLVGSSLLGGLLLADTGVLLPWVCWGLVPVGIGVQYLLFGRHQRLFSKCVPDRVRDLLTRRKAGRRK